MKSPLISVVMAVHNGLPYLSEAIDSIFSQTLGDFEFICIDDASTDGGTEMMAAVQDPRWRFERNRRQSGLSVTLNRGMRMARGMYLARMDADDISMPRRFEAQAKFLNTNPGISVVGAWAKTMGLPREQVWELPASSKDIKAELLFNSAFVHSAVMLRRENFLRAGLFYNPSVARAQDYDLWERAAGRLRFANLTKVLLHYRIHAGQVGHIFGQEQAKTAATVRARQLKRLGLRPSRKELDLHNKISTWKFEPSSEFLQSTEVWLLTIERANQRKSIYDADALGAALEHRWWAACRAALLDNREAWNLYTNSSLAHSGRRGFAEKAVFWIKTQWPR